MTAGTEQAKREKLERAKHTELAELRAIQRRPEPMRPSDIQRLGVLMAKAGAIAAASPKD